jgi:mono/diheme cytochrome c family protein
VHERPHPSRHLARLLCLTLAACFAAACGNPAPQHTPEQVEAGSKAFQSTCATCHGRDANGLPKLGKGLLMNPFVIEKTDEELVAFLKTGRRAGDPLNTTGVDMPPKGGNPALTDEDLVALVAYLRTLQTLK